MLKISGLLFVLGMTFLVLDKFAIIKTSKNELSDEIKERRKAYLKYWSESVPHQGKFVNQDTFVVYHTSKKNNFRNKDDFSRTYHPKTVTDQSCEELGIGFIQVRNIYNNKLLSGIACNNYYLYW